VGSKTIASCEGYADEYQHDTNIGIHYSPSS
jgi:hypothetical protein